MRGDGVDARRSRNLTVFVDHIFMATLFDRRSQLFGVETDTRADAYEIVDLFQLSCLLPVGFEQRVVHLVELALLAGKLCRAQGAPRVDDHVAYTHLQS